MKIVEWFEQINIEWIDLHIRIHMMETLRYSNVSSCWEWWVERDTQVHLELRNTHSRQKLECTQAYVLDSRSNEVAAVISAHACAHAKAPSTFASAIAEKLLHKQQQQQRRPITWNTLHKVNLPLFSVSICAYVHESNSIWCTATSLCFTFPDE